MEAGFVTLAVILTLFLGILIGAYLGWSLAKRNRVVKAKGILNVDYRDSENRPDLWLQLDVPVEDVVNLKQVLFNVTVIK